MEREKLLEIFNSFAQVRRVLRDQEIEELPMEFRESVANLIDAYELLMGCVYEHFMKLPSGSRGG